MPEDERHRNDADGNLEWMAHIDDLVGTDPDQMVTQMKAIFDRRETAMPAGFILRETRTAAFGIPAQIRFLAWQIGRASAN